MLAYQMLINWLLITHVIFYKICIRSTALYPLGLRQFIFIYVVVRNVWSQNKGECFYLVHPLKFLATHSSITLLFVIFLLRCFHAQLLYCPLLYF